ncbi:unnamed protein product [Brassica rapa subsp. narinosa]
MLVYFEFHFHHVVALYKRAIKSYEFHVQWLFFIR